MPDRLVLRRQAGFVEGTGFVRLRARTGKVMHTRHAKMSATPTQPIAGSLSPTMTAASAAATTGSNRVIVVAVLAAMRASP